MLVIDGSNAVAPVDFSFEVKLSEVETVAMTIGSTITGSINGLAERDIYTFTAAAGEQLYFDGLTASSILIDARLVGPSGQSVINLDTKGDSGFFSITESGDYRLVVDGANNSNGLGEYSFRLLSASMAEEINLDSTISGTLEFANGVNLYRLPASERQQIRLGATQAALFGTAQQLSNTTSFLEISGGFEDGYDGINAALKGLTFRPGASVNFILITDEDRDILNSSLSFSNVQNGLSASNASLDVVVSSRFQNEDGTTRRNLLGVDARGNFYEADGLGNSLVASGNVRSFPAGTTGVDYIDLAFALGGGAWDLTQLRAGGLTATSFTKAFVDAKTERIVSQLPLDVIASNPNIKVSNLTGEILGIEAGDTANFEIELTGDGTAQSFDLLFVRPDTNIVLGSIPVTINNDYLYKAQAVDADGDTLTYSLIASPTDAVIDAATGQISWEPPSDGNYRFTVQVSDGRGGIDQQSYSVVVTEGAINGVPMITSTAPSEALYEQDFRYQVKATDPDGDALNYYLADAPDGVTINRTSGQLSWTPTKEQGGERSVTVRVLDGRGGEATQTFRLNVGEDFENSVPEITSEPLVNIQAQTLYRYQVEAQDLDNDTLRYDLTLAPKGMTIDENSGEIVWRPTSEQEGIKTIVVRVRDGRGGLDLQAFTLRVGEPNVAPVITSVASETATAGFEYEYRVRSQDADGTVVGYRLSEAPDGMTIDETTGVIRWQPTDVQLGEAIATVIAIDNEGAQTAQTFAITVAETTPNEVSVITSTPRTTVRVDTPYFYRIDATDPNGDPLSYQLLEAPEGMTVDEQGLVSWVPTIAQQGSNPVRIQISDGRGGILNQSFEISVGNLSLNRAPEVTSLPESYGATVNRTYRYNATAVDPDGDIVLWQLADAPSGMSLDPATGTLRWQPTADQVGRHTVSLEAIDAQGGFSGQSFELVVRGVNTAPLITSIPLTEAATDRVYQYQVQATDSEGNALTFQLLNSPDGMTIGQQTGLITWQPTAGQTGLTEISVAVTDAEGAGTTQIYQIETVAIAPNRGPAIVSQPVGYALTGASYRYQVQAQDPDDDALTYELIAGPAGMILDSATGELLWVPTAANVGSYIVTVGANDGRLGSAQRFTLQVAVPAVVGTPGNPAIENVAPEILSTPETVAAVGQAYRYDLRARDGNGDRLQYTLTTAPEGMTIDSYGRIR